MAALKVCDTTCGRCFVVDINPTASMAALRKVVADVTSIPAVDQIFILSGEKLSSDAALVAIAQEEPHREHAVFLFDRRWLVPNAEIPAPVNLPIVDFSPPELSNITLQSLGLAGSMDTSSAPIVVKAILEFLSHFTHDVQLAKAIREASMKRLRVCESSILAQQEQCNGWEAAVLNLNAHYHQIDKSFSKFYEYYSLQKTQHASILDTFDSDLNALGDITIPEHLKGKDKDKKTLLDCVDSKSLKEYERQCKANHTRLCERIEALKGQVDEVSASEEKLKTEFSDDLARLRDLNEAISRGNAKTTQCDALIIKLESDRDKAVNVVKSLYQPSDSSASTSRRSSSFIGSNLDELQSMQDMHTTEYLKAIRKIDEHIQGLMLEVASSHTAVSRKLFVKMQLIAGLQTSIRRLGNKIAGYTEALAVEAKSFRELQPVKKLPSTFRASITESLRREKYEAIYRGLVSSVVGHLDSVRAKEIERRKKFHKHNRHILSDLFSHLSQPPSEVVVSLNSHTLDAASSVPGPAVSESASDNANESVSVSESGLKLDLDFGSGFGNGFDFEEMRSGVLDDITKMTESLTAIVGIDVSAKQEEEKKEREKIKAEQLMLQTKIIELEDKLRESESLHQSIENSSIQLETMHQLLNEAKADAEAAIAMANNSESRIGSLSVKTRTFEEAITIANNLLKPLSTDIQNQPQGMGVESGTYAAAALVDSTTGAGRSVEPDGVIDEMLQRTAHLINKLNDQLRRRDLCAGIPKIRLDNFKRLDVVLFVRRELQRSASGVWRTSDIDKFGFRHHAGPVPVPDPDPGSPVPPPTHLLPAFYEAFNVSTPNCYLSVESEQSFFGKTAHRPDLVVGQIIAIEPVRDPNVCRLYGHQPGIIIHIIHAEMLTPKIQPHCRECIGSD